MINLSIIIPVYNIEAYLDECISSLSSQTYDTVEFILVDDGSTDASGEICDRWTKIDSRFRVIHQSNNGVSDARNTGLKISNGQWIGFVDGDDWIEPDAIEYIMAQIKEYPTADAVFFGFFDYYAKGNALPALKGTGQKLVSTDKAIENVLIEGGYFTSIWNKFFRRDVIFGEKEMLRFDPSVAIGEDEKFLIEALLKCRSCLLIEKTLYHYRYREGSALNTNLITSARIESLYLKRNIANQIIENNRLYKMALARLCNRSMQLLISAYCLNDRLALKKIRQSLKGTWHHCFLAKDISLKRKIKVLMVYLMIDMRFPVKLVKKLLK